MPIKLPLSAILSVRLHIEKPPSSDGMMTKCVCPGAALALIDAVYLPLHLPGVSFKTVGYGMPRVSLLICIHITHNMNSYLDTRWATKSLQTTWMPM